MQPLFVLLVSAITIAFSHTLVGVDHYIPFIALGKSNSWSTRKTLSLVLLCGIGHVLSSVVLGFAGIALSTSISRIEPIQAMRGDIAMWFLIAFGLVYTVYGIRKALKNSHHHTHAKSNTAWGLFILFVLGPCEPLIPIFMYPAATHNLAALITVTLVYALCTIGTMLIMTYIGLKGLKLLKVKALERYTHALAGFAVLACGLAILFLGI